MPKIITENFKVENTHALFDTLSSDNYYIMASTSVTPTEFEQAPGITNSQVDKRDFQRKVIFANKLGPKSARYMFLENSWQRGTVYDQYDDTKDIETLNMIVTIQIDSDFMVLKCLDNNNGAPSQEIPGTVDETNYSKVSTEDGYVWQYMFTVTSSEAEMYRTPTSLPLPTYPEDGGGYGDFKVAQRTQEDISRIDVVSTPIGQFNQYLFGRATDISNASDVQTITSKETVIKGVREITVSTTAITGRTLYTERNSYKNMYLRHNESGKLYDVLGSETIENTIKLTVRTGDTNDSFTPSAVSGAVQCQLVIKVLVSNSTIEGETCKAYGVLDENGTLKRVSFELTEQYNSRGTGYKFATAQVVYPPFLKTSVQASGQETTLRAVVSPRGGHGSDPISELAMSRLAFVANFSGSNINTPNSNFYSMAGLIKNPIMLDANGDNTIPTNPETGHVIDNRLKIVCDGNIVAKVSANNYIEQYIEHISIQQAENGVSYTIIDVGNLGDSDQFITFGVPTVADIKPGTTFVARDLEQLQVGSEATLARVTTKVDREDAEYDYSIEVIKARVHQVSFSSATQKTTIALVDHYGNFESEFQKGVFYINEEESSAVSINNAIAEEITYGEYQVYSGDLLHFIDFSPIERTASTIEKVKFTFDF